MNGRELIQFIQEHNLEDYQFQGNFADDNPFIESISEYTINIDRENSIVTFEIN